MNFMHNAVGQFRIHFPITSTFIDNDLVPCLTETRPDDKRSFYSLSGRLDCVYSERNAKPDRVMGQVGILTGLAMTVTAFFLALADGWERRTNECNWGTVKNIADTLLAIPIGIITGLAITILGLLGLIWPAIAFRAEQAAAPAGGQEAPRAPSALMSPQPAAAAQQPQPGAAVAASVSDDELNTEGQPAESFTQLQPSASPAGDPTDVVTISITAPTTTDVSAASQTPVPQDAHAVAANK